MARTGRPSKFTHELQDEILTAIESTGIRPRAAAAECGVTPTTYTEWMAKARDGVEPYVTFRQEVARAELVAEGMLHRKVLDGDMPGQSFGVAKAALELITKISPDRYSQQIKVQLRDDLERILDVVHRVCGPEDFLAVCEALAEDDREGATREATQQDTRH